jgi:hypothetical protein
LKVIRAGPAGSRAPWTSSTIAGTVDAAHDGDEVDVAGHHARELAGVWEKHAHSSDVGARRARHEPGMRFWPR